MSQVAVHARCPAGSVARTFPRLECPAGAAARHIPPCELLLLLGRQRGVPFPVRHIHILNHDRTEHGAPRRLFFGQRIGGLVQRLHLERGGAHADPAAHRVADQHAPVDTGRTHGKQHIGGQRGRAEVGRVAQRALAVAAQVQRDGRVAARCQVGQHARPRLLGRVKAVHQHRGGAAGAAHGRGELHSRGTHGRGRRRAQTQRRGGRRRQRRGACDRESEAGPHRPARVADSWTSAGTGGWPSVGGARGDFLLDMIFRFSQNLNIPFLYALASNKTAALERLCLGLALWRACVRLRAPRGRVFSLVLASGAFSTSPHSLSNILLY
eukprot:scaffold32644_cov101-Isochrysis_galbana.AAC.2